MRAWRPLLAQFGRQSFDIIMGTELVYTPNEHHHQSLKNVIERYLKPDGVVWFCQSDNRCDLALDLLAILHFALATCQTNALVFLRENGNLR
jgi:hypothetical protein